jgi:phage-related protein
VWYDPQVRTHVLDGVRKYLTSLSEKEQAVFRSAMDSLGNYGEGLVRTKQLRGPVRELIIAHHRVTYFRVGGILYFVRGFRKKSRKTPRQEIEYAERTYRLLTQ